MSHSLRIDLLEFSIRHPALQTSRQTLGGRRALLLGLHIKGDSGWGEACPLEGFGLTQESFEQARATLLSLKQDELKEALSLNPFEVGPRLTQNISSPSARHAVEAALLSLMATRQRVPLWRLLGHDSHVPPLSLPTSQVLDPLSAQAGDDLKTALNQGITTFKLKCGRDGGRELAFLDHIAALSANCTTEIEIRLDANLAWSPQQARRMIIAAQGVLRAGNCRLGWIEDPTPEFDEWSSLSHIAPIAVDEPLSTPDFDVGALGANVAVLKPMVLGGITATIEAARRVRRRGLSVSLSHFFDGPVALATSVHLAFALQSSGITPGLGRHRGLDGWTREGLQLPRILKGQLPAERPWMELPCVRSHHLHRPPEVDELSVAPASSSCPEGLAFLTSGAQATFGELARAVSERREQLHETCAAGFVPLVAEPSLEAITELFAAWSAGVPVLLLSPRLPPGEQQALVRRTQQNSSELRPGDAAILPTSGSTGRPHLVVHTRQSLQNAAKASLEHLAIPRPDDRWLLALPFGHVGGLSILVRCLMSRACVVMAGLPHCGTTAAELLGTFGVTVLSLVPTQLHRLLETADASLPSCVRCVLLGGASAPPSLLHRAEEKGVPVAVTYGMTEMASQIATRNPSYSSDTSKRAELEPLPGVSLRTDDQGRLSVRGPMMMRGYLDEPFPIDRDGYLITGDLAHLHPNGKISVLGRVDNVIVSGGENVSPEQVEAALCELQEIRSACVLGLADPVWGQRVIAAVVSSVERPVDSDSMKQRLRQILPSYAIPKDYVWLERLPTLASGKIDRKALYREIGSNAVTSPLGIDRL